MRCPFRSHLESKVIDSRPTDEGKSIRRRRECLACNKRFTTYEVMENIPIIVIKKDKTRQTFDHSKLTAGILKACTNRPVSIEAIEEIVYNIEATIQNSLLREISSDEIANMVMQELKTLDEVAYVRFASVTNRFSDVDSFLELLNELKKNK